MRPQVAEGKQHAEGLLHAEEAVERPFPVELDDGEGGGHATGCDDVLARVVTLGGAIPEHQAVEERDGRVWPVRTAVLRLADLETLLEVRQAVTEGSLREAGEEANRKDQGEDCRPLPPP